MNLRPKNPRSAAGQQLSAIAAIDVGSSATRLVVARPEPSGLNVLLRQRVPLRLGTEVFSEGRIGDDSARDLIQAFVGLSQKLRSHGVGRYRAVATSALRDAANGAQVLAEVQRQSGIRVDVITGAQEAELMRRSLLASAAQRGLAAPQHNALLMDLGGGSLELMRADGSASLSLPLGTVRLLGRFACLRHPMSALDLVALSEQFVSLARAHLPHVESAPEAFGTGGNIEAMAKGLSAFLSHEVPTLAIDALLPAACGLAPLPVQMRAKFFGLHPGRADLLLPAVLIVHAVGSIYCLEKIYVPGGGIRDALLMDLVAELTEAQKFAHTTP